MYFVLHLLIQWTVLLVHGAVLATTVVLAPFAIAAHVERRRLLK